MELSLVTPEAALDLMERALAILDATDVPADIGAHLDLAIERLSGTLGRERTDSGQAFD